MVPKPQRTRESSEGDPSFDGTVSPCGCTTPRLRRSVIGRSLFSEDNGRDPHSNVCLGSRSPFEELLRQDRLLAWRWSTLWDSVLVVDSVKSSGLSVTTFYYLQNLSKHCVVHYYFYAPNSPRNGLYGITEDFHLLRSTLLIRDESLDPIPVAHQRIFLTFISLGLYS